MEHVQDERQDEVGPAAHGDALEEDPVEVELVHGYVESIEDGVANVLLGEDLEEWCFPASLLPEGANADCVLLIEVRGREFTVVDIDHSKPTVESRLGRDLLRRRPIVLPLPHRPERRIETTTELEIDQRVSRLARNLGGSRPV